MPTHLKTGRSKSFADTSQDDVRERVQSANAYLGAWPIVEALEGGAHVVITGRATDTGLTLAPLIHEFGWGREDWDVLSAGTVAGWSHDNRGTQRATVWTCAHKLAFVPPALPASSARVAVPPKKSAVPYDDELRVR